MDLKDVGGVFPGTSGMQDSTSCF